MYDIFLSYATADRQRVRPLAAALKQQGWSVFWDHESVRIGQNWRKIIADALVSSRCVVVVWTEHSIHSNFVIDEASKAKERGVLLPLLWANLKPPHGFRGYQTADFCVWDHSLTHPVFHKLVQEIQALAPAANAAVIQTPQPKIIQAVARLPFEPEMVEIPAGRFTMGWVEGRDGEGFDDEKPAHTVNLKRFELGKYPVTQAQWQAVMGDNPSHFQDGGDTCPVEQVSWDMAQQFIQKLNALSGKTYRLPSEAEWEYACRGGENHLYSGSNDIDQVAWYTGNSGSQTHPVGQKQANAWGLHDMSGNVLEWVQDTWHDSYQGAPSDGSAWEDTNKILAFLKVGSDGAKRVLRGGSWYNSEWITRAALRDDDSPSLRSYDVGFRLARTPQ